ncbi:metalloprotease [Corynebacterium sp. 4HC-13]|uniref:Metalloprotease n=2 Tax=Corynebacterium anserum TaxID=2684406 RepID=A0A7G7YR24_9CORY|nr:metalloprotease [Corynebacterium anserum]QNH96944.1 metalloprotease [Corynebacterium anserum]
MNGGGGMGFGGGRGGNNGNFIISMLAGLIGRKFGIPGVIIAGLAVAFFSSGGTGIFTGGHDGQHAAQGNGLEHCATFEDANKYDDCRIAATAKSLDEYWSKALPDNEGIQYHAPDLRIAEGQINTGCGSANISQTGPFYCPGDKTVYMSIPFFDQLKKMGGSNGAFSQMYVTAHEFGHHIQQHQGTLSLSNYNDPGQESMAVQIELQADCYAGLWASNADKGDNAMLDPITQDQVQEAITTTQAIGDDTIQSSSGQEVNPDLWTHGSSQQRTDAFLRGYQGGTMDSCRASFNK